MGAVAHAGGVVLTRTAYATGLSGALSQALVPWRKPLAVHDPAKVLTDLALSLALGGDALCDAGLLRAEPGLYDPGGFGGHDLLRRSRPWPETPTRP